MRRIFLFLMALSLSMTINAAEMRDKVVDQSQLPAKAKQMLDTYFNGDAITVVTYDSEWFGAKYDVHLRSGVELEFNQDGDWLEVDSGAGVVPQALVPAPIIEDITRRYGDMGVKKIERDNRSYEVELVNRVELEYNLKFELIGFDD